MSKMTLAQIQALAAQAAETGPDMTEAVKGGGGGRMLPEGYAFARLVEYVEFGQQPQEFNGQAKDPAMEIQLGFALWGDAVNDAGEVIGHYHNDDGSPYIIRPYPMALSRNEKARAFLLFKALNWKGTATHFAQLLGTASWLVKIVHEDKSKTDKTKVSRLDLKSFLPPLNPINKQPYQIPEAPADSFRVFLWDYPTIETWDALYVEGNFDDGRTKNFLQETILSAVDFSGSALEALLLQSGKPIPKVEKKPATPATSASPKAAGPVAESAPAVPATPAAATPVAQPAVPAMPSMPAMPDMAKAA